MGTKQIKLWCLIAGLFLLLLFGVGCGDRLLRGMIYNHTRIPLTLDLNNTPSGSLEGEGSIVEIKEPVSRYGFYASIKSNAIGDIAKKYGIKTVYYADKEIFSILGIWTSQTVHIYGE